MGRTAMGPPTRNAQRGQAGDRQARTSQAQQRRLELDKDREARHARIDQAVADVYLAQDERDDAGKAVRTGR
jgi:hypothetical protein